MRPIPRVPRPMLQDKQHTQTHSRYTFKKQCAICEDKHQLNVRHTFKPDSQNTHYYICAYCREASTFKIEDLKRKANKTYRTYLDL